MIYNKGLILILIFSFLSIISYFLYREIGEILIKRNLKQIQMNDCLAFDEEVIGKQKYFIREYFVKKTREENMNIFEHAVHESKKNINQIGDIYNEDCKNNFIKILIK